MTINGAIARSHNELVDWTSREDKKLFAEESKKAGVVIMGRRTYDTIGRPLKDRLNIILTSDPKNAQNEKGIAEFTNEPLRTLISRLEKEGYHKAAVIGGSSVNAQFLKENLIDEIILSVEPFVFGKGLPLFAPVDCERKAILTKIEKLNDNTITLYYSVIK